MEHRWGQRVEIRRRVRLRTRSGVVGHGMLHDVSISGAFIVSPLPARLLSYIQVQFTTADHGYQFGTAVEGQIVRRTPQGFALEWCEFAPEVVATLAPDTMEKSQLPDESAGAAYRQFGSRHR